MAGTCSSIRPPRLTGSCSSVELSRLIDRAGVPFSVRISTRRNSITRSQGGGFTAPVSSREEGPSCIFVGPIDSARKETLEALYRQAKNAYYNGKPLIVDDMFDRVELKLRWYGSKSVVKYPRCSLLRQSTYADAEDDASQVLLLATIWILILLFGSSACVLPTIYGLGLVYGGDPFNSGLVYSSSSSVPLLSKLNGILLTVLGPAFGYPIASSAVRVLKGLWRNDLTALKGDCPNCGEEVFAFVRSDQSNKSAHKAECHVCECTLEFRTKVEKSASLLGRKWVYGRIYLVSRPRRGRRSKHLFKEAAEPTRKVVDVLTTSKQKRNRDGYEDGESILWRVSSASDFIWSENPLEILGTVTSISFDDEASRPLKEHELTSEEIKILCDDLPVLGKNDFKHILKWRMQIRKALTPEKKEVAKKEPDVEKEEENEDDKLLNELEELTNAVDRKKKQAKKLLAKRRAKDKTRKATNPQIDALEDGYVDHDLFSLAAIKGKKDLMAVDNDEDDNVNTNDIENENRVVVDSDDFEDSGLDSDEERQRYTEIMEEAFDEAYDRYMEKKEGSAKQRKRARQAHAEKLEEGDGDEEMKLDYDSDMNVEMDEANPLMVPLDDGETQTKEEISNQWFSQDIFAEAVEEGDLGKDDSDDDMPTKKNLSKAEKRKKAKASKLSDHASLASSKKEDDFEIVPAPVTDSDSDSSSDDDNVHTKAEILACAKKMLRKKQREEMLDDAYNKYMYGDEGFLPKWFLDDEKQHRQPMKPVTKEEINAMKAQFREINARPAKKVAEAKARKKRAAAKRLEKVRKKANVISDTTDISDRSKDKMIDKLYKKAAEPRKPKKELVVSKKGVGVKVGKGQKRVDRRMKSDARQRGGGKPGRKGKKSAPGNKSGQKKPRGKRPMGGG